MLSIRKLEHKDYDLYLSKWWKDWKWQAPPRGFLPDDGEGGFMVCDEDYPVVAGFLYVTNSKIAWSEFVISNFEYRHKENREKAIQLLLQTLEALAVAQGKKFMYSILKNKSLISHYKKAGYMESSNGFTEMIKICQ